jgi:hypothetical protein
MPHTHICKSKFHDGSRQRSHYDDHCTEARDTDCFECHDLELERKAQPGKPRIVIHSVTQIPDSNNKQHDRI